MRDPFSIDSEHRLFSISATLPQVVNPQVRLQDGDLRVINHGNNHVTDYVPNHTINNSVGSVGN